MNNSGSGGSTIDPATLGMLTKQSADLNRTDTSGTYGSSKWSIDPTTGRYTQNVNLDPSQQKQLDARNGIAETMIGNAGDAFKGLNGPFGYSSDVSPSARASFDDTISRLKPQFDQQNRRSDQDLANGGIPIGSEAYDKQQQQIQQGQNDQVQQAATGSANAQNSMDLTQRQQNYSDIANMLGSQNTQTPTAGTQAAIDTTGNFNMLNGNVNSMFNNAASKQAGGTSALIGLLGTFL